MKLTKWLFGHKYDREEYIALLWKRPDKIDVFISEADGSYFAKLTNFTEGNVVTQAGTGQELIEMVNAAMYEYLDIPEVYWEEMGYFLPPEEVRQEMKIEIPRKYLERSFSLVKA